MSDPGLFAGAVAARGKASPDLRLYHLGERSLSCGELLARSSRLARGLRRAGVSPGERVALSLPAGLDFVAAYAGIALAGGVPFALPADLAPAAAARRAALGRPALLVGDESRLNLLSDAASERGVRVAAWERLVEAESAAEPAVVPPAVDPEATAILQYTSGTTGEPRLAQISHRALAAWRRIVPGVLEPIPGDVQVGWVPPWHIMGLVRYVLLPIVGGIETHLVEPKARRLGEWIALMARVGCTRSSAPDFALRTALRLVGPEPIDLSRLRLMLCGGEAVKRSTIDAFERRFDRPGVVLPGYGLSEATLSVASALPGEPIAVDRAGNVACGRPFPGVELAIVDADGRELAAGGAGEIRVRCDALFSGYFEAEGDATHLTADGWLATGDWGRLGPDGELYVLGRRRNLLKHGGATYAPREFEEAAEAVGGVAASAAIALRHRERPDAGPVIVVELQPGRPVEVVAREVAESVRRGLGLVPGEVLLVEPGALPRTAGGKLRHAELRRQLAAGELGDRLLFGRADGWLE